MNSYFNITRVDLQNLARIKKRDGQVAPFNFSKISQAVLKAMTTTGEGNEKDADLVARKVVRDLLKLRRASQNKSFLPNVEMVQDLVEEELMLLDFVKTAKSYILYREKRAALRAEVGEVPEEVRELVAESKKYFRNSLAEFVYCRTYARWIDKEGRRETWIETVQRFMDYMKENLGKKLTDKEYEEVQQAILKHEAMPSMRLMQFSGPAAKATNVCAYNCSYIAPSKVRDFSEIMYVLMCGAGAGYSVESQNIQALPQIKHQTGKKLPTHVVGDSKEGWANALELGMNTWFKGEDIEFDLSKLRSAGTRLKTMGGKSSGPEPLRQVLEFARDKIMAKQGKRLSNLDAHDIICKIGECVVAGGVRRSALISLSDLDDVEMRDAKKGQFYMTEPQRSMANNSAVYNEKPTAEQFFDEWIALMKSGSGERGIFNRGCLRDTLPKRRTDLLKKKLWPQWGTNPCLTGDTLVYLADGRGNVPVRQLAQEGKDVPVFCYDNNGRLTVRTMRHPRLTGKKRAVYKVTLDDGSAITATENHKFRLHTGEFKAVMDLQAGDSLKIVTRFEASIKDVVHDAKNRSQDYWWINNGQRANEAEHRLIAEFAYNTTVPRGYVVHHKDFKAQNNKPANLLVLPKAEHDALHGDKLRGDNNPMRRARWEWSEQKWKDYRVLHSHNNRAEGNQNFSGVTNQHLRGQALRLTKQLGRRFSHQEWVARAQTQGLPMSFSKWRRDHLGGIRGLAKWAAFKLGLEYVEASPRVVKSYQKYIAQGYDCEIVDGRVLVLKKCEVCGVDFQTTPARREQGVCSISCGLKGAWRQPEFNSQMRQRIQKAHQWRKIEVRERQIKIYNDLRFATGQQPLKKEWVQACRRNKVSFEIARSSSPFRAYADLQEAALNYNHRVVAVEFAGFEDVYNGTVDEFHNFFVGGFAGKTRDGKRKAVYLNNLQCGEIILRSKQFCNLSEVVARADDTEETLLRKARIAAILGTYQSTLTYFPYLSEEWKKNCEEERLLGVSVTGQWDCPKVRETEMLLKIKEEVLKINRKYAKRLGINPSSCATCVKPSGNVSQMTDCASGMHPRHSRYYIRRVRVSTTDALFKMLRDQGVPYHPEVGQSLEDATTYVLEFPVQAPEGAILKNDLTAIEQLEHWKKVKINYTEHNPSVTVSVGNDEWVAVANWLYENWSIAGGLSFLPRSDHVYQLAPYEEIDENKYEELVKRLGQIDYSKLVSYEREDELDVKTELACVSGTCEI